MIETVIAIIGIGMAAVGTNGIIAKNQANTALSVTISL